MSINGIGRPQTPGFAVGTKFPNCTVVAVLPPRLTNGYPEATYECRCNCGRLFVQKKGWLQRNSEVACKSCAGKTAAARRGADGRSLTPEWTVWCNMRQRCTNPTAQAYNNYGARGIKVCKRWKQFDKFLLDMGPRPEGYTLERKNNNKGYTPKNCEWVPSARQNRNTRTNNWLTVGTERMLLVDWARRLGTRPTTIWLRINKYGWSVAEACTVPVAARTRRRP